MALTIVVVSWWLVLGAVVGSTILPESQASASKHDLLAVAGMTAHIKQPGLAHWPIPVSRLAFDTYARGVQESDEDAIESAFSMSAWIDAPHGQAVRILEVDGETVHVELIGGPYDGRQGWLASPPSRSVIAARVSHVTG